MPLNPSASGWKKGSSSASSGRPAAAKVRFVGHCRLVKPTGGRVLVEGEVVTGTSPHVGYMLQRDNLLEWRTILDNVLFGLEIQQAKTPENVQRAVRLLETYGLAGVCGKISAAAVGRHAPARRADPHAGGRTGHSAAGRGVFSPGLSDTADRHRRCVRHFEKRKASPH